MKKKIILILLVVSLFVTGCNNQNSNGTNNSGKNNSVKKLDHKVYKYMKISASTSNQLYYYAEYAFDDPSVVGYADTKYNPCLIVEFDTNTGSAKKVTYYGFFLDYEEDEWVNKAIEKYETSSDKVKKEVSNVKKGRVNDNVSYLKADIIPGSYAYDQYVQALFKEQDIEKYKKDVYFDNLYNYEKAPDHEEGDNYFEDAISSLRIEWSDSEIKAY